MLYYYSHNVSVKTLKKNLKCIGVGQKYHGSRNTGTNTGNTAQLYLQQSSVTSSSKGSEDVQVTSSW